MKFVAEVEIFFLHHDVVIVVLLVKCIDGLLEFIYACDARFVTS